MPLPISPANPTEAARGTISRHDRPGRYTRCRAERDFARLDARAILFAHAQDGERLNRAGRALNAARRAERRETIDERAAAEATMDFETLVKGEDLLQLSGSR